MPPEERATETGGMAAGRGEERIPVPPSVDAAARGDRVTLPVPESVGGGPTLAASEAQVVRAAMKRIRRAAKRILREARRERRAERRRERAARREAERRSDLERRAARRERRLAARALRHERTLEKRRRAKLAREFGAPVGRRRRRRPLRGIAAVRSFLRTNTLPIYVVSATPFTLLGLDRWVHDLYYLSYVDPFDGAHPRVFAPPRSGWEEFHGVDEMVRAVLRHPETAAFVAPRGPGGKALLLSPDAETERLAAELGLEVMLPPPDVRDRVARVATAMGPIASAPDAVRAPRLVLPAVATAHGTLVGPLMTELVGPAWLTPYADGRCGTEMWSGVLPERARRRARKLVRRAGDALAKLGFRGAFEATVGVDGGRPALLGARVRIGGAASMTNASAGAYSDVPLLCFHLLEHLGVDYRVDLRDLRARWADAEAADPWTELVVKDLEPRVDLLTAAPRTGIWRMTDDGGAAFDRPANDWHGLLDESEAFVLRIVAPGDFRYLGVDLATLVVRGRMRAEDGALGGRARRWVDSLRREWEGLPVRSVGAAPAGHIAARTGNADAARDQASASPEPAVTRPIDHQG